MYSVKKLADLAGVSVRTLHLYDEMGLLKPSVRTEAGYRLYSEKELLRLQQILFYKELDFPLRDIAAILDDPGFDILRAFEHHRKALTRKKERLHLLLHTVDQTISKLKNAMKLSHEELYQGFPKEKAKAWRNEAIEKYGADAVQQSEQSLMNMDKEGIAKLKKENQQVVNNLLELVNEDPTNEKVQTAIAQHYQVIRKFWGTHGSSDNQAEAYAGLGQTYINDDRFVLVDGKVNKTFALFMSKAMAHFAKSL